MRFRVVLVTGQLNQTARRMNLAFDEKKGCLRLKINDFTGIQSWEFSFSADQVTDAIDGFDGFFVLAFSFRGKKFLQHKVVSCEIDGQYTVLLEKFFIQLEWLPLKPGLAHRFTTGKNLFQRGSAA
jgi:hypothetical protein